MMLVIEVSFATTSTPTAEVVVVVSASSGVVFTNYQDLTINQDTLFTTLKSALLTANTVSLKPTDTLHLSNWYTIVCDSSTASALIDTLKTLSFVELAGTMPYATSYGAFNDGSVGSLWHLQTIDAFRAFDISSIPPGQSCKCNPVSGEEGYVSIAVLDDAFTLNHEDLAGVEIQTYNAHDNTDVVLPALNEYGQYEMDLHQEMDAKSDRGSHGTAVAALAVAKANNGKGVIGTGHGARLIAIDVMKDGKAPISAVVAGLAKAYSLHADVISMSFGVDLSRNTSAEIQLFVAGLRKFFEESPAASTYRNSGFHQKPILIAAAGNVNGTDITAVKQQYAAYPANYEGVLSVGNTMQGDHLASQSMFGDGQKYSPTANGGLGNINTLGKVNILAPGNRVLTAVQTDLGRIEADRTLSTVNNRYFVANGTSMSAPIVAGVVARMLMINPNLDQEMVESALQNGAEYASVYAANYDAANVNSHKKNVASGVFNADDELTATQGLDIGDGTLGFGRVNAYRSLLYVREKMADFTDPQPRAATPKVDLLNANRVVYTQNSQALINDVITIKDNSTYYNNNKNSCSITAYVSCDNKSFTPTVIGGAPYMYGSASEAAKEFTFIPTLPGVYTFSISICTPNSRSRKVSSTSIVVVSRDLKPTLLQNGTFEHRHVGTFTQQPTAANASIRQETQRSQESVAATTEKWDRAYGSASIKTDQDAQGQTDMPYKREHFVRLIHNNVIAAVQENSLDNKPASSSWGLFRGSQAILVPFEFRKGVTYEVCYAVRVRNGVLTAASNGNDPDYTVATEHQMSYRLLAVNGPVVAKSYYNAQSVSHRLNGEGTLPTGADNAWHQMIAPKPSGQQFSLLDQVRRWFGIEYNGLNAVPPKKTILFTPAADYSHLMLVPDAPQSIVAVEFDEIRIVPTQVIFQLPGNMTVCQGTAVPDLTFGDGFQPGGPNELRDDPRPPGEDPMNPDLTIPKYEPIRWYRVYTGSNNQESLQEVGREWKLPGTVISTANVGKQKYRLVIDAPKQLCSAISKDFEIEVVDCGTTTRCSTSCENPSITMSTSFDAATCCYNILLNNTAQSPNCYIRLVSIKLLSSLNPNLTLSSSTGSDLSTGAKVSYDVGPGKSVSVATMCIDPQQPSIDAFTMTWELTFANPDGTTFTTCQRELPIQSKYCNRCCNEVQVSVRTIAQEQCGSDKCCYELTFKRKKGCIVMSSMSVIDGVNGTTLVNEVPVTWTSINDGEEQFVLQTSPDVLCFEPSVPPKQLYIKFSDQSGANPRIVCQKVIDLPVCMTCAAPTFSSSTRTTPGGVLPDGSYTPPQCCIDIAFNMCNMYFPSGGSIQIGGVTTSISPNQTSGLVTICGLLNATAPIAGTITLRGQNGAVICRLDGQFFEACDLGIEQPPIMIEQDDRVTSSAAVHVTAKLEVVPRGTGEWEILSADEWSKDHTSVQVFDATGALVPCSVLHSSAAWTVRIDPHLAVGYYWMVVRRDGKPTSTSILFKE
ncbi:MAG: S8 family peptidase [Bacteroidetes bacterium]|nr:S8 family peptidase [Bacteroidota bacterium]